MWDWTLSMRLSAAERAALPSPVALMLMMAAEKTSLVIFLFTAEARVTMLRDWGSRLILILLTILLLLLFSLPPFPSV